MYIETFARIIQDTEIEYIQYFIVGKYGHMQYVENPPDTIEFFKNGNSKLRAKIKLKNQKYQSETDIISINI